MAAVTVETPPLPTSGDTTGKEKINNSDCDKKFNDTLDALQKATLIDVLKNHRVSPADFKVGKRIGKGGEGCVYKATSTAKEKQSSKRSYAIKKVHKKKSTKVLSYNGSKVLKEVVFLSMAAKENKGVTEFYGWYEDRRNYYIVMEYLPCYVGMFEFLKPRLLSDQTAKYIFHQIVYTVWKCHQNGVVHRDLRVENIMIDPKTKKVKIIDFGMAELAKNEDAKFHVGHFSRYSPEMLFENRCNVFRQEVWALGHVLYDIFELDWAFNTSDDIIDQDPEFTSASNSISFVGKHLCKLLLRKSEHQRPSIPKILAHPWFKMCETEEEPVTDDNGCQN